jgi:hypothetical protein
VCELNLNKVLNLDIEQTGHEVSYTIRSTSTVLVNTICSDLDSGV